MTLKELRLDLKAKTNAFEGDPLNEKAKAAYLASKKAYEQAVNDTPTLEPTEQDKAANDSKKAATNPKKAATEAKKGAFEAAMEAGIAAIAAKAAADKAEVEAKEAADKAAETAKTTEPTTGAVTENPNAEDELKKS